MGNTLQKLQDEVEAMEKMFNNPTEEVAIDMAHSDPAETLDGMMEDVNVVEEVEVVEEPRKPRRTNWKARYSTYKATTDATIYELRKEKENLISQIQGLNKRLDTLNKSTADADTTKFADRFTEVDREILGEDALNSFQEATDAAVKPLKEQLANEKAWREEQLELQRIQSGQKATNYFLSALANTVPDYAEIDTDPAFEQWMSQPDKVSGIPRVSLFKRAEKNGDVSRVASFMNEFKELNKPVDNLKDKVSPVSTSTASPVISQGDTMSMADVNKYYDDVMKGKYRNNEKARVEMESKVNTALGNGDVY